MNSKITLSDFGQYPDSKYKKKKKEIKGKRTVVVITLFVGNDMRTEYPVRNEDLKWETGYRDNKLANLQFTIKCHQHFKAGIDYDLILIDNWTEDKKALEYYKTLTYPIYKRENNGFSFGGYKYAWEKFKNYDYYLFHEQDFVPCKDGWLKEIYDAFQAPDLGVIGNVVEYRDKNDDAKELVRQQMAVTGTHRNYIYSIDGAWYFTSKQVLKEVDEIGGLRLLDGKIDTSTFNEILFIDPILELGYKAGSFGNRDFFKTDRIHWYGSRKGSLIRPFDKDKLVPIVDGITRLTCPQMRQYFNEAGL